jgi:hypothetical protein
VRWPGETYRFPDAEMRCSAVELPVSTTYVYTSCSVRLRSAIRKPSRCGLVTGQAHVSTRSDVRRPPLRERLRRCRRARSKNGYVRCQQRARLGAGPGGKSSYARRVRVKTPTVLVDTVCNRPLARSDRPEDLTVLAFQLLLLAPRRAHLQNKRFHSRLNAMMLTNTSVDIRSKATTRCRLNPNSQLATHVCEQ